MERNGEYTFGWRRGGGQKSRRILCVLQHWSKLEKKSQDIIESQFEEDEDSTNVLMFFIAPSK